MDWGLGAEWQPSWPGGFRIEGLGLRVCGFHLGHLACWLPGGRGPRGRHGRVLCHCLRSTLA